MLAKVCILLVIFSLSTAYPYQCTGYCSYHTISVSGSASIAVQPDTAQINIQITGSGNTTSQAVGSLGQSLNSVISILNSNGINDSNYQSTYFSVYPNISYPDGTIVGQIAYQQIQVTIFPINLNGSNIASVYDGLAQVNGIVINSLYFRLSNQTSALTEVRAKAYKNVLNKADDYAFAAGAVVGQPISIFDQYTVSSNAPSSDGAPGSSASPPTIPTTVSVGTIQIIYYLSALFGFS